MFDVGFSELVVIGVIALLVFGPEDLPRVARTVGHLLGKLRRYVADVKSEINREMEAADLKRLHSEMQESVQSIQAAVNEQAKQLETEFHQVASSIEQGVASASNEVPPPTPFVLESASVQEDDSVPPVVAEAHDQGQLDLFASVPENTVSEKKG